MKKHLLASRLALVWIFMVVNDLEPAPSATLNLRARPPQRNCPYLQMQHLHPSAGARASLG